MIRTISGKVKNDKSAKIKFKLPQFSPTLEVQWRFDVVDMTSMPYDAIMGRDLARRLGIDV